jgi:hypothetical protein
LSIAILIGVHDGLVLATDSASTLVVTPIGVPPAPVGPLANVYNNANKIFNLIKGERIGCATYGAGSIGNASIATLIKDLRRKLTDPETAPELGFNRTKYTMKELCGILAKFLDSECAKIDKATQQNTTIGFLVGGYSTGEDLGESWFVEISQGKSKAPVQLRKDNETGISWGGQGEVVQRIVLGFSPAIFQALAEVSQPEQNNPEFQHAIDLARFLVHSAIMFSRFLPGYQVVGGPIEIAAITKHEGFKWITRKHYFDQTLNPEA